MVKKVNNLRSLCCNAPAKVEGAPDFVGDNPKNMRECTCWYACTKCHQSCDVYSNARKTWTINPKTQIVPNKREKIRNKEINKEIKEYGHA